MSRTVDTSTLLVRGIRAGFSVPSFLVFVAMIGFGSLAKSLGLSLAATILSAAGIYGLPGQVAMLEAYATGASLLGYPDQCCDGQYAFFSEGRGFNAIV